MGQVAGRSGRESLHGLPRSVRSYLSSAQLQKTPECGGVEGGDSLHYGWSYREGRKA